MKKNALILFASLLFVCSFVDGQIIKQKELIGLWSLNDNKNDIMLEFFDSSRFTIDPENIPGMLSPKKYTLTSLDNESLLTLYFDNGGNLWNKKIYLIRKSGSDAFILQIPDESKTGKIIFKWKTNDKKNTFYLYQLQRKKETLI